MIDETKELRIPKSLFEKLKKAKTDMEIGDVVDEILQSQMFQMLNDYPIPQEWCLHLRQIVYPAGMNYIPHQCLNCKKYF